MIDPDANLPQKVEETYLEMMQRLTGQDLLCCPNCKKGRMTIIKELPNQLLDST
ncbi:putative transposase [Desulfotignum phosphitoxidans DSM 13687]|uniref:Putative transposase n=1 Tax=Desulfotignum phosphitoxidans DSM 13687 TaxID=1286635 RepID=S0G0V6_9BACT|nr:putative transposase [Desulfotignum phosphitoxidans DSM 13687]